MTAIWFNITIGFNKRSQSHEILAHSSATNIMYHSGFMFLPLNIPKYISYPKTIFYTFIMIIISSIYQIINPNPF